MKKIKRKIIIFILIILFFVSILYVNRLVSKSNVSKKNKNTVDTLNEKPKEDNILRFSVLGDVHGNTRKLSNAIADLYNINNNTDALILNGDNVDQGTKIQYNAIKDVLYKNKEKLPKTIIKNIGNHDYFNYSKGANTDEDVQSFISMYLDFSGEKSVYHDTWIKGYHFISLGSENGNTRELGPVNADLSENQLNWLSEKLEQKHEKGKPIFVFLHQHLNTSIKGWMGVEQRRELIKILSKYPEVVLFTSHTHVLLSVDNITTNQPFTTAHTGSVYYSILPEGYNIKRLYNESQGLYVEVEGNKTVIKGRDFVKKTWIFSKEIAGYKTNNNKNSK